MWPVRVMSAPTSYSFSISMSMFLPRQCRKGAALWRVLQLNDSYDLEAYLDMSQVSGLPEGRGAPSAEPPPLVLAL